MKQILETFIFHYRLSFRVLGTPCLTFVILVVCKRQVMKFVDLEMVGGDGVGSRQQLVSVKVRAPQAVDGGAGVEVEVVLLTRHVHHRFAAHNHAKGLISLCPVDNTYTTLVPRITDLETYFFIKTQHL